MVLNALIPLWNGTSTACAAASSTSERKGNETMIENWRNNLIAALSMLGAGFEGVTVEMPS